MFPPYIGNFTIPIDVPIFWVETNNQIVCCQKLHLRMAKRMKLRPRAKMAKMAMERKEVPKTWRPWLGLLQLKSPVERSRVMRFSWYLKSEIAMISYDFTMIIMRDANTN